jgi:hypothetical protein
MNPLRNNDELQSTSRLRLSYYILTIVWSLSPGQIHMQYDLSGLVLLTGQHLDPILHNLRDKYHPYHDNVSR